MRNWGKKEMEVKNNTYKFGERVDLDGFGVVALEANERLLFVELRAVLLHQVDHLRLPEFFLPPIIRGCTFQAHHFLNVLDDTALTEL